MPIMLSNQSRNGRPSVRFLFVGVNVKASAVTVETSVHTFGISVRRAVGQCMRRYQVADVDRRERRGFQVDAGAGYSDSAGQADWLDTQAVLFDQGLHALHAAIFRRGDKSG